MDTIPFIVDVPDSGAAKGLFSPATGAVRTEIPTEVLRQNLARASEAMLQVLSDLKNVGRFRLSEVELQVEVTAEGGVNFIGSATLGAKGAITLKFVEPTGT